MTFSGAMLAARPSGALSGLATLRLHAVARGLYPTWGDAQASAMKSPVVAVLLLGGCVYVPFTTVVYDEECRIEARHMAMQPVQLGALGHCQGQGCAELLVAAGAVAAASAVVSGSI